MLVYENIFNTFFVRIPLKQYCMEIVYYIYDTAEVLCISKYIKIFNIL